MEREIKGMKKQKSRERKKKWLILMSPGAEMEIQEGLQITQGKVITSRIKNVH
jgi:hypothetical protein